MVQESYGKDISIIFSIYNEEESLRELVSRTEKDLPTFFQIPEPFNRKIDHLYVLIIPAP